MARPWRMQFPGAIYHVAGRGNNRQAIFLDDDDRRLFLDLLGQAAPRFRLRLFAFCLMTNHYHLFLRTEQANLAAAMHWLNATYTIRFNRRRHRSGHLFQGRYQAVVVAEEAHWEHLSFYLHLNPVRAGLAKDPADYPWSSFRDYTHLKSRYEWLKPELILDGYGGSPASRRRRYRRTCLALAGQPGSWVEEIRSAVFLGPREKLEELSRRYGPAGQVETVPEFTRARKQEVDSESELKRVGEAFGVESGRLRERHRPNPARLAAYYHLVQHCGLPVHRAADLLGVSPTAVSLGIQAVRQRLRQDRELKRAVWSLTNN
jgi:putative transposase